MTMTMTMAMALALLLTMTSSSSLSHSTTLPILQTSTSSSWDLLLSRDSSRLAYLSSLATGRRHSFVSIASGSKLLQTPTYIVRASLGSPPQPLLAVIDTSSDTAWFPSSAFKPNLSSSFKPIPCSSPQCSTTNHPNPSCTATATCNFNFTYGSSSVLAALSTDTVSLSTDIINSYVFGAVINSTGTSVPPQGLLGFGRGPLSFLSQTISLYASTFSYCLPGFRSSNFSGTLRLGPSGQPVRIKTTPLLSNPRRSSLYYVNLLRIRVGRWWVAIPSDALAFNPTTGAGTIIDSGTMFTRLVTPAYVAVRDEFRRRVRKPVTSLGGFDTCFSGPIQVPTITFEFTGMNVTLPVDNIVIHSSSGDLSCLAMAAAPDNVNSVVNVIASMQQQNHRVLFDGANGRVGFAREPCTSA